MEVVLLTEKDTKLLGWEILDAVTSMCSICHRPGPPKWHGMVTDSEFAVDPVILIRAYFQPIPTSAPKDLH